MIQNSIFKIKQIFRTHLGIHPVSGCSQRSARRFGYELRAFAAPRLRPAGLFETEFTKEKPLHRETAARSVLTDRPQLEPSPQPSGGACSSGPAGREHAALRSGAAAGCRSCRTEFAGYYFHLNRQSQPANRCAAELAANLAGAINLRNRPFQTANHPFPAHINRYPILSRFFSTKTVLCFTNYIFFYISLRREIKQILK